MQMYGYLYACRPIVSTLYASSTVVTMLVTPVTRQVEQCTVQEYKYKYSGEFSGVLESGAGGSGTSGLVYVGST